MVLNTNQAISLTASLTGIETDSNLIKTHQGSTTEPQATEPMLLRLFTK